MSCDAPSVYSACGRGYGERCWNPIRAASEAKAYDIVLNGVELGGGSIRIHDRRLRKRMFACPGTLRRRKRRGNAAA